ncbi:MAG: polyprenyl synthetase family protein [Fibrobacteraceae bacterium]|nr:polyprenyl synthetase family protein [Fibrobacteraceae bacterium]
MNDTDKQSFQNVLSLARGQVQEYLTKADDVVADVARSAPVGVSSRMGKLIQRKGKKIRSTILSLLACTGKELPDLDRVAHACAGIELLHLASLVHDDIIDETTMRRGERTAHMEWGNKIAVLIGDYILSQAMRCVINEKTREIPLVLSSAANNLIVGEISELDSTGDLNLSLAHYNEIIQGKTAALVDASARIGALLAGFDAKVVEECGKMGTHFGLAFQIIDDLLDYGIGAKDLDKAKFTDISNGLVTLPLIYYFESCPAEEKASMKELLSHAAENDIPEKICAKLESSNAFEKAKNCALEHVKAAIDISKKLPPSKNMDTLTAFFFSMSDRQN